MAPRPLTPPQTAQKITFPTTTNWAHCHPVSTGNYYKSLQTEYAGFGWAQLLPRPVLGTVLEAPGMGHRLQLRVC